MKRALVILAVGVLIGQLDPLGRAIWQVVELQLPSVKERSLAEPSPYEQLDSSSWIAESPNAYVVENNHAPESPVHLLVIPKQRYPSVLETPTDLLGEMLGLARDSARELGIAESGFRITINTNPQGGQTVYHLHMHVLGGRQQRSELLPLIWGRLTHLWHAA